MNDARKTVRELAAESADGVSWFEQLYSQANQDAAQIPWSDRRPNRNLINWLNREQPRLAGKKALVVGCGLGDDAELLSRWQFDVTAFDISPSAIAWAQKRFTSTRVKYVAADLFATPSNWTQGWDFVFEAYTVQPLPMRLRSAALAAVARLVAPGGQLLFISRAREPDEQTDGPPWPLTRDDIAELTRDGLNVSSFEDYMDDEDPPVRRFRVVLNR